MTAPTLTLSAESLLWPDQDMGAQIQAWVDSPEVQEYLRSTAARHLDNPLLASTPAHVRARWQAFATEMP